MYSLLPSPRGDKQLSDYRNVEWLAKQQAVTILPSVASLGALRGLAKANAGAKPLIGYANPVFNQETSQTNGQTRVAGTTRSYTTYYRGTQADLDALRHGLTQLPETANELRAVAKLLGVPESEIHLGEAATETAVKQAHLDDYRIIYFATHGLVAGAARMPLAVLSALCSLLAIVDGSRPAAPAVTCFAPRAIGTFVEDSTLGLSV